MKLAEPTRMCHYWSTNDPTFDQCGMCDVCQPIKAPLSDNNTSTNKKPSRKRVIHASHGKPKRNRVTK